MRKVSKNIAAFLKQRRAQAEVSLDLAAEYIGVSAEDVRSYEEALKPVPVEDLFSLANILNIPPEDVLQLIYELVLVAESQQEDIKTGS